jgi:hypothetical protein
MTPFPLSDDPAIHRLAITRPFVGDDVTVDEHELSEVLGTITAQRRGHLDPVQRRRLGRAALLFAAGGATALALLLAVPGTTLPSAAEVLTHARAAVADTTHDIVELHQARPDGATSTGWLDIATGASYGDSFAPTPDGIVETRSWVLANGQEVNVDLREKWWWETPVGTVHILVGNMPSTIAGQLRNGTYSVVGQSVVGGVSTLELSQTIQPGETETLWVDASTYLPVKAVFSDSSGTTSTETYAWEPANSTTEAVFTVKIPSGLTQVTGHGRPGSAEWFDTRSSGTGSSGTPAGSGNTGAAGLSGAANSGGN